MNIKVESPSKEVLEEIRKQKVKILMEFAIGMGIGFLILTANFWVLYCSFFDAVKMGFGMTLALCLSVLILMTEGNRLPIL